MTPAEDSNLVYEFGRIANALNQIAYAMNRRLELDYPEPDPAPPIAEIYNVHDQETKEPQTKEAYAAFEGAEGRFSRLIKSART